jgi:YegS/Rv2252/BmrU family lipid kinase
MTASGAHADTQPTIVILNPSSGRGRGDRIKVQLQTALTKAGIVYDLVETTRHGEAIDLAQKAYTDGYGTFVAVGGDGTVSEVVNGLVQAAPAEKPVGKVAIISVGSGNDFAHAWHISSNLEEAAKAIAKGTTQACDLGKVTIQAKGKTIERHFNNNFGTGLDAQVTLESLQIKRLQGAMLYGTAALRALWKLKTPVVDLRWEAADGESHERHGPISLVSVGNTPRSGGGFQLTPGAQMDDGLLDLGIADALSRWQLLQLLPKALQGNHVDHPGFTLLQFRKLRLTTNDPLPVEMDGEVITEHAEQIDMHVQPARLQMIV